MVRTHPETGKKALFLGRRINAYVIGLPVAESEELLDELWTHGTQEKFTWAQEWQVDAPHPAQRHPSRLTDQIAHYKIPRCV